MGQKKTPASDKPAEDGAAAPTATETPSEATSNGGEQAPSGDAGESGKPAKEEPAAEAGPEKRAPEQWAKRLGKVGKNPGVEINKKARPAPLSWDHAAADQIHGWSLHGQHTTEPLLLERADYEAALEKAKAPDAKGEYQPHPGALSPFKRGK